jgi:hypothetical protein
LAAFGLLAVFAALAPGLVIARQSEINTSASQTAMPPKPLLKLTINGQTTPLGAAELNALAQKTVTFHNVHTKADETYTGVPLTDLLAKYGAPTGDKLRGKGLSEYIVATGSDGYKAVLSLAETDPSFHPGDVIVADSMDGKPLDEKEGPFKLVVTEDKRPRPLRP